MGSLIVEGMDDAIRAFKQLPLELGSRGGGPLQKALLPSVRVIHATVLGLAPERSGNLKKNLYIRRMRTPSTGSARYLIGIRIGRGRYADTRVNRRLRRVGRGFTTRGNAWYWWLLEFGFSHVGSGKQIQKPFMRKGFWRSKEEAIQLFARNFAVEVEKAAKRVKR